MDAIASNLFQIFQHSCTAFQHFYYDENLEKRCVRVTLNLRHFDMLVRPILSIVAGQKAGLLARRGTYRFVIHRHAQFRTNEKHST